MLCALHTGTYWEMPLTTVSHLLRLAPTGCTYCEFYLRCSHCVWLVPPVFALHVDHTYCVCTPYGSHLLCLHSVWLAPTVFALPRARTYYVCTSYGSHLLCSHSIWLAPIVFALPRARTYCVCHCSAIRLFKKRKNGSQEFLSITLGKFCQ